MDAANPAKRNQGQRFPDHAAKHGRGLSWLAFEMMFFRESVGSVGLPLIDRIGKFGYFFHTVDIGETYTTYTFQAFRFWNACFLAR